MAEHASPDRETLADEQRRETNEAWAGPGQGAATPGQAKGFLAGSLGGGVIGALLALPFGFIEIGGMALWSRLLMAAVIGAVCGGVVGSIYLGGRVPELEGETSDVDGRPSVGSTPRDPSQN